MPEQPSTEQQVPSAQEKTKAEVAAAAASDSDDGAPLALAPKAEVAAAAASDSDDDAPLALAPKVVQQVKRSTGGDSSSPPKKPKPEESEGKKKNLNVNGWTMWLKENREAIKKVIGEGATTLAVSKEASLKWKSLSEAERGEWARRAKEFSATAVAPGTEPTEESNAVAGAKAQAKKRSAPGKIYQASLAFKKEVQEAVAKYIEANKDSWTLSVMQEELAEQHSWEIDQFLKIAVKAATKSLGFTGSSAYVPNHIPNRL